MNKGKEYEDKACDYLKAKGYKILQRNFRSPFGEIDIIVQDKDCISFVEVKARNHNHLVSGAESVTRSKINKIRKTALFYVKDQDQNYRFDVLEIIESRDCLEYELIEDAFPMKD
jgi:putative endonuclease